MKHFTRPPTVADIARGLSTIPRWTSRTVLNRAGLPGWTVLQHTLVCMAMASRSGPVVTVYAGLHDLEEILTGDIPSPYKTEAQSALGDEIRNEGLRALGLPPVSGAVAAAVHDIDIVVRYAEKAVLLHPRQRLTMPEADMRAVDEVWGLLDLDVRAGIELYVDLMTPLMDDPRVRTLRAKG